MRFAKTPEDTHGPFRRSLDLLIIALGGFAFAATLVLGAYAPDLRSGHDGGAHVLSNGAIGFSGLARLADQTGRHPEIARIEAQLDAEDLAIITPTSGSTNLTDILVKRRSRATLIVLPKWEAHRQDSAPGWVLIDGLMPPMMVAQVMTSEYPIKVMRRKSLGLSLRSMSPVTPSGGEFHEPPVVQTVAGSKVKPLIVDSHGGVILGQLSGGNLYLLADPDLMNNYGIGDHGQAAAALALLDQINSTDAKRILFDVTANGFGHSRSPLRLAFDPPFLAVTLVLIGSLFLAGWQAMVRFGAVRVTPRAIAFGKAALIENSSSLVRKARREARLGGRYAALVRERAAVLFHLPPMLSTDELDSALDRLRPEQPFSTLAAAVREARDPGELAKSAAIISRWFQESST